MHSLASGAALLLAILATTTRTAATDGAAALEIARLLRASMTSPGADLTELERRLTGLGSEAMPDLFATLAAGSIPAQEAAFESSALPLSSELEGVLTRALARQPRELVSSMFESLAQEDASERERETALLVLSELGGEQDLRLALRLATTAGEERVAPAVCRAFEHAAQRILTGQPMGVLVLADEFPATPPGLFASVLRSISSVRTQVGFEALSGLLHAVPAADALVLGEMGRFGGSLPLPVEERLLSRVRTCLESEDPTTLTLAMLACGSMDDVNSVGALIPRLNHPLEHVRSTAWATLRKLSGLPLGPDAERWTAWHHDAVEWWRKRAPAHLAALDSADRHAVSEAIHELAKRSLFRHETARPIARCLDRRQTDLQLLACAALGHLGSETAVPELIGALESPSQPVARAAEQALRRITGKDLGPAPGPWRALDE
jgi:HEAT repeat protein